MAQYHCFQLLSERQDTLCLCLVELQLLWNIQFFVISVECYLVQIQPFPRGQIHPHLLSPERLLKDFLGMPLHLHLYQQPNHLPNLVVDETLSQQLEPQEV